MGYKAKRQVRPPTYDQVMTFADAADPQFRVMLLTAAFSGLRCCEVLPLRGDDLEDGILDVRRGKGAKQRYSVLFEPALAAFVEHRDEPGLKFRTEYGIGCSRAYVHKHMDRTRDRCGMHGLWFHDLRKFHASWLLDKGVTDMDVAIQLGHMDRLGRPNVDLVRNTYGWPSTRPALERVRSVA